MDIDRRYKVVTSVPIFLWLQSALSTEIVHQFQYQCYRSLCTFPLEYCSSVEWERRCIPCLWSVCRSKEVPLACKFNCTFNTGTLKNTSSEIIGQYTELDNFLESYYLWMILAIVLFGIAAILAILLVILLIKIRRCRKTQQEQNEIKSPLMQGENGSLSKDDEEDHKNVSSATESPLSQYCAAKLKGTPVTDSLHKGEDEYKPTTHLQK